MQEYDTDKIEGKTNAPNNQHKLRVFNTWVSGISVGIMGFLLDLRCIDTNRSID